MNNQRRLKITRELVENKLTPKYLGFRKEILRNLIKGIEARYRLLVVLSGDDPISVGIVCSDMLIKFSKVFKKRCRKDAKVLYIFHDEFPEARIKKDIVTRLIKRFTKNLELETAIYEESERFLGTTYQGLVMDIAHSLKPNDIGRLIGIVEGGGLIILLAPNWDDWHNRKNLFQLTLTVPQHPEPRFVFTKWFKSILLAEEGIFIYDLDRDKIIKKSSIPRMKYSRYEIEIPLHKIFPDELYRLALTQDQIEVIKLIEQLVKKPIKLRTSIVIVADRGRGKSCAVGIGVVGLIQQLLRVKNRVRVAVTAPSLLSVQSMMTLATKTLETLGMKYRKIMKSNQILELRGERFSIEYWEPVHIPKLRVDIAVVDEAAGIAVPLLHQIWKSHRRSIFATTIHGYEGAGRGFSVRFLKRLKEDPNTELHIYEMEEPIRYAKEDPVEKWQFRALLLDAEPDELSDEDLKHIENGEFEYLKLDPYELFTLKNEKLLRSLFGIYVLAHYRNEPDDLGMMADAPHHSIRALRIPSGKIVAAAQLAEEGPIPDSYIDNLLRGGKIPGNILPDRLLKHLRIRDIAKGRGWRIVRIAVHPLVQGRGIGSYMLKELEREARERGYDWIGSGFGATEELLNFWIKNNYIPVHISPDRNPVSGEFTVLVIKPLKEKWKRIVEVMAKEFRRKILEALHDPYRYLEVGVAHKLLLIDEGTEFVKIPPLSSIQIDRLMTYVLGPMTYEACSDIMHTLAKYYWIQRRELRPPLKEFQEKLLIAKALQGRPWDEVAKELEKTRHRLINEMRKVAKEFLKHYYDIQTDEDLQKSLGHVEFRNLLRT